MEIINCDFCKKERFDMYTVSEPLMKRLPDNYRDICDKCESKITNFIENRRKEHLDSAWNETARFALSINNNE